MVKTSFILHIFVFTEIYILLADEIPTKASMNEWGEGETLLLLDRYALYLDMVGPMKRFRHKKAMWQQIAAEIYTKLGVSKTPEQCMNRLKTVKRRRTDSRTHNKQSGVQPVPVEYDAELQKIAAIDDSMEPELMRGPGRVELKAPTSPASTDSDTPPPAKKQRCSVAETLWKIHVDREEQRERRHKEKMELLRRYLGAEDEFA
ncbi:hypothetical protein HPB48_002395 [Haemaphysalis longicornis]|uniref:Myb/SANT-like DNA-binding domain-containing protein n=1 Tax=Haemaphysalis longicornis TaxID=44386 RepID=A0A9J6G9Y7_HAELO|nr:hypothetical protein HPB48_002395 [Haemaphysalis longicornis]